MVYSVLVGSHWVTWTYEHQKCTSNFVKNRNGESTCEYLPYYKYFKTILNSSINELKNRTSYWQYYINIAEAVVNLYDDFEIQRNPMIVNLHQAHQRGYYGEKDLNLSSMDTYNDSVRFIHPISFGIPEEIVVDQVPSKIKPFGRVIPGVKSTYFDPKHESLYYEDMQRSLFVFTYKKAGWDCFRHYEILASGALPLFLDIKHCPHQALSIHPKKLYHYFLSYPGLNLKASRNSRMTFRIDVSEFESESSDVEFYLATVQSLLQYTRNVLTTRAIAKYVLETMYRYSDGHLKSPHPKSLLYLTHENEDMDSGDYMVDLMLHGFLKLLGTEIVTDFPRRKCLYKTLELFNYTKYFESKKSLYGKGFSWGHSIDVLAHQQEEGIDVIKEKLSSHQYDMVILGSGHRDNTWGSKLHLWDLVCSNYHPLEVGFIEGNDYPMPKKLIQKYSNCAGHFFSREGYAMK